MAIGADRISRISDDQLGFRLLSTTSKDADPQKEADQLENGALRSGGPPKLFSKEYLGLVFNYAAIGIVYGALPGLVYPFFRNYLVLEGYQIAACSTMMNLPWSYKMAVGIVTDSFPIIGFRRRPYMVIGWLLCFASLLVMALMKVEDPFYRPDVPMADRKITDPNTIYNRHAKSAGAPYIFLMMLSAVGYIVADVAADGMVVELAQRESLDTRGKTQTYIYLIRTVFSAMAGLLIAFTTNGKEYGGDFNFSLQINGVMGIIAIFPALALISSVIFVVEEKVEAESFVARCKEMWDIAQKRAIWQIMMFQFLNSFFQNISWTASTSVQSLWAHADNFNNAIFSVVGNLVFASALYATQKYFLNTNWRYGSAITIISVVVMDSVVSYMTIFNVFRNKWFWLGVPILEQLPYAVNFIITCYVSVEVADIGYESTTYGLLTTVNNLAQPFSSAITNQIDKNFKVTDEYLSLDTAYVRGQVATIYTIANCFKLFALTTLVLLPKQKKEAQQLKLNGGKNMKMAVLMFCLAAFALVYSTVVNVLAVIPSTSCLEIAGGSGCDSE